MPWAKGAEVDKGVETADEVVALEEGGPKKRKISEEENQYGQNSEEVREAEEAMELALEQEKRSALASIDGKHNHKRVKKVESLLSKHPPHLLLLLIIKIRRKTKCH